MHNNPPQAAETICKNDLVAMTERHAGAYHVPLASL
jgi:hypothetical protein